ncbi:MAG: hypothetical protein ACTSWN_09515, partial [Promethearchaeota archaeon]
SWISILSLIFRKFKNDSLIKSILFSSAIIFLTWFLLLFDSVLSYLGINANLLDDPNLFIPKIIIFTLGYFFVPGFCITLSFYPFKSSRLDFYSFKEMKERHELNDNDEIESGYISPFTRIIYSVVFSISLTILLGYLIGLSDVGFNIFVLQLCFLIIEISALIRTLKRIKKSLNSNLVV